MADVSRGHFFDSARRLAIGLEITNQHGSLGHRKAVDLTGDRHCFAPTKEFPDNGNLGAAARHKKFTEAGVINYVHDLLCEANALRALQLAPRPGKIVFSRLASPLGGDIRQRLQETVHQQTTQARGFALATHSERTWFVVGRIGWAKDHWRRR